MQSDYIVLLRKKHIYIYIINVHITEKHMNHTFHAWSINTFCKVNNYVWIILIYKKTIFAKY